jgi:hypothetical protein
MKSAPPYRLLRGIGVPVLLALFFLGAACGCGRAQNPTAGSQAKSASTPEIWFAPMQDSLNPNGPGVVYSKYDFPKMVASTELWKDAAANLSVLGLGVMHMTEHYPDLSSVLKWIDTNHFVIAAGGSLVNTGTAVVNGGPGCTHPPVEGLTEETAADFAREIYFGLHNWKQKGGRLDYLALDSPFYFGYYHVHDICHYSIAQVAQRTAITVNKILEDFPDARIVDYEGPGPIGVPTFLDDYAQFIQAFNAAAHRPISDLGMDLHWIDAWHSGYRWIDAARRIADFAHARGIRVGLFMDAEDQFVESPDGSVRTTTPVTEASWMQMVRGHMMLARTNNLPLDFVILASWVKFPTHNLPETDPLAMTSLVNDAYRLWNPGCKVRGTAGCR